MIIQSPLVSRDELVFLNTRLIDAPTAIVFKAWADPQIIKNWWGPNGFTNEFDVFDFQPNGNWIFNMIGSDGTSYPNHSIFREIIDNERIVLDHISGHTFRITATFTAVENQTKLTFHMQFDDAEEFEKISAFVPEANEQNLNRLEVQVAKLQTLQNPVFSLSREFNAPKELVYSTFTKAEHLCHWWGPAGFKLSIKAFELRPNGFFHYQMKSETFEMWGKFEYFEITAPDQIVLVSSFADAEGNIIPPPFPDPWPVHILNVWSFTEQNDKTTVTIQSSPFKSSPFEAETFANGITSMQDGYGGTFAQLENYLSNL